MPCRACPARRTPARPSQCSKEEGRAGARSRDLVGATKITASPAAVLRGLLFRSHHSTRTARLPLQDALGHRKGLRRSENQARREKALGQWSPNQGSPGALYLPGPQPHVGVRATHGEPDWLSTDLGNEMKAMTGSAAVREGQRTWRPPGDGVSLYPEIFICSSARLPTKHKT